jgi:tRNA dimethylallyltransferase
MQATMCLQRPPMHGDGQIGTEPTTSAAIDYTLGLYQSIGEALHSRPMIEKRVSSTMSDTSISGYREFSSYLTLDANLPTLDRDRSFQAAIERMKISTRQYAKRQVSWIRNKWLPAVVEANRRSREDPDVPGDVVPTFLLDASGKLSVHRLGCRGSADL